VRRALTAITVILCSVAVAGGIGLTSANASPATAAKEDFQFATGSTTSYTYSAIATGKFTAGGTVKINLDDNPYEIIFPRGTIKVHFHPGETYTHITSATCLYTQVEDGTYKLNGGTGAYRKIGGSGTAVSRTLAVMARNSKGKCTWSKNPFAYQQVITQEGTVSGS
jgi:hypothetical protein